MTINDLDPIAKMPAWEVLLVISIICVAFVLTAKFSRGVSRADIDQSISENATLKEVLRKLDNDNKRIEASEKIHSTLASEFGDIKVCVHQLGGTVHDIQLSTMRAELFQHTDSRQMHEHQLDVGKEYLNSGGNGAGHVRLEQLEDDYQQRLELNDWDY